MLKKIILLYMVMLFSVFVNAETAITKLQREKNKGIDVLPSTLSLGVTVGMAGTVSDETESEGQRTASVVISPRFDLDNGSAISASFSLVQETEIERLDASNLSLIYTLPSKTIFNDNLSLGASLIGVTPTNGRAYRDESFRGSAGLTTSVSGTIFKNSFPVNLSYSLSGGRFFHKYRRNNLRSENTEYFAGHAIVVSKSVSKLTLTAFGEFRPTWSYEGFYNPSFTLAQSLSYRSKGFTYSISHANGGGALDYDGDFDNIRPFDDYTSRISVSLGYRIN